MTLQQALEARDAARQRLKDCGAALSQARNNYTEAEIALSTAEALLSGVQRVEHRRNCLDRAMGGPDTSNSAQARDVAYADA